MLGETSKPTLVIISDDHARRDQMGNVLKPYCSRIRQASTMTVFEPSPPSRASQFILVTGIGDDTDPRQFFERLRQRYPQSRLVLVVDELGPEVELSARAAGTLFIGSQAAFCNHVEEIFQSVGGRRQAQPKRVTTPAPEPQHQAVMVVDDEPKILRSIQRVLCSTPCMIHPFQTPSTALAALDQLRPTVVITDYRMPEMNGIDFLSRVKRQCPASIRLVMTGNADFETVLSAINRCQAYKFILKPWDPEALRADVVEALAYARLTAGRKFDTLVTDYLRDQSAERMTGVHELATAVCHEMGQPLQVISGWAELLLMDDQGLGASQATRLQQIRDEVRRMGSILENLRRLQAYRTVADPGGTAMFDIRGAAGCNGPPPARTAARCS